MPPAPQQHPSHGPTSALFQSLGSGRRFPATATGGDPAGTAPALPPHPAAYDRPVATATPSPTPNPNATRFTLDTTLPATINVTSAEAAQGNPFAEAVFAAGGVASIYGVNDFVTVNRQPGADWDPIVSAVQAAAQAHL